MGGEEEERRREKMEGMKFWVYTQEEGEEEDI